MSRLRWVAGFLLLAGLIALVAGMSLHLDPGKVTGASLMVLLGLASCVVIFGPLLIGGFHRFWTRAIPTRSLPAWYLARANTLHNRARTTAAAAPVVLVVSLIVGLTLTAESLRVTSLNSTGRAAASGATASELVLICGLGASLALVGAASALFMASQQRERELALSALAGATPGTQIRQVIAEAIMVSIAGIVLATLCVATSAVLLSVGLDLFYTRVTIVIPYQIWASVSIGVIALNTAANLLPTLPMLHRHPHRVLA